MNTVLIILLGVVAALIVLIIISQMKLKKEIVSLNEQDFKANMRKGQLIDVRNKKEYEAGHINGARNIPISMLSRNIKKLRTDQPIYLYCASGTRSKRAGVILISKGYTQIFDLRGGISSWTGKLK